MKNSYRNFCEGTSMHGFAELYRAKSVCGKISLLAIIVTAIGVTVFQVYGSTNQFINQPLNTVFQPATEDDLVYPSLKYCIPHWFFWYTDYNTLNWVVDTEVVLYAMSYLTPIYRLKPFNESVVKNSLVHLLSSKALTLEQFYKSISRTLSTQPKGLFIDKELLYLDEMVHLCYTANETKIRSLLDANKQMTVRVSTYSPRYTIDGFVEPKEYIRYLDDWCFKLNIICIVKPGDEDKIDLTKQRLPDVLVVENYNNLNFKISPDVSEYSATVKVSVHKWKNTKNFKCVEGKQAMYSEKTCYERCAPVSSCYINKYAENCTPVETFLAQKKSMNIEITCRNNITFIDPNTYFYKAAPLSTKEICDNNELKQCMSKCLEGCNRRSFDLLVSQQVTLASKTVDILINAQTFNIQYPTVEGTSIMVETDSRTWEDFIGTVGGLLGVWTGASIMSLFQVFYLCCCSESNNVIHVRQKTNQCNNCNKNTNVTTTDIHKLSPEEYTVFRY